MKVFNKNTKTAILIVFVIALISGLAAVQDQVIEAKLNYSSPPEFDSSKPSQYLQKAFPIGLDPSQSCTIIYASDGKIALAGNNEDWNRPIGNIWFLPAEKGKFGRVYFGWRFNGVRYPQGGMNDQGLFFDGATAESVVVPRDKNKIPYEGNLILKAMEECSTVEEALKLYDRYDV
jgi:hypothetical protein